MNVICFLFDMFSCGIKQNYLAKLARSVSNSSICGTVCDRQDLRVSLVGVDGIFRENRTPFKSQIVFGLSSYESLLYNFAFLIFDLPK